MKRNTLFAGIVCLAIGLLGAPGMAQSTEMIGPELRQWIENPALGLAALREGRIPDLPKAPEGEAKAAPRWPTPAPTDKAVAVTFVDPGMEEAARFQLNRPVGPIYDEELASFQYFDASGRGVQELADLQYMPNLSSLRLEHNDIASVAGLQYAANVFTLYLQDNKLASLAGFPLLHNLQFLSLDSNRLTSFAGLPTLPQLSGLYARRNQIGTLSGMPSLPALQTLLLDHNQLVSLAGMPELPNLRGLFLSSNRLSGVAGLPNNADLNQLDLSKNALQSLAGMPEYRTMGLLDISTNQLTTADGLYKTTHVLHIYAGHNRLESLGALGQITGLHILTVEANRLTSLAGISFSPDLVNLDVSQNRLSSLTGVENCPLLGSLNASGNCLKSLGAVAGLENLHWLSLSGCGLTSLADLPTMLPLDSLDVSCNRLITLADIGYTPSLRNLEAKFNRLQTLDTGPRPMLGYLGLSSNGLTSLATLNGANAPRLYMIDVSFNQLVSLQGVENVPSLTTLAARANQITSLAALSKNPLLNWLDVSSNQLSSFEDLPPNPPISWLTASRNHIASLHGLAAAANLYLSRLDVSRNLLTSVAEVAAADQLYRLDVSNNQITDIAPLVGRHWQEMGIANNPTGDVQPVLFNEDAPAPAFVSVGPGQLPSLAPFANTYINSGIIQAEGPEYADLSLLGRARPNELRVTGAAISSLDGLAASFRLYQGQIERLALPNNALTDLSPLSNQPMQWLDVSGNNVADIAPVTSDYLNEGMQIPGIDYLNLSSNPIASLAPALGRSLTFGHFRAIGASIIMDYQWEQFGLSPEQAHNCMLNDAMVDVTGTPVATAPEVEQLRAEGVMVRTDGTCSYCQDGCISSVTVPDVTGMTREAASAALSAGDLTTGSVTQQCSGTVAAGNVIGSDPAAGVTVEAGSGVALVVASGPCTVPVAVPNVVGRTASDAIAAIQAAGLSVGAVTQRYSAAVPEGMVISQNPTAGTTLMPHSAVALVLSLGPNPPEGEIEGEGESPAPLTDKVQALLDGFGAADTNGDGRLSLAEAQAAQPGLTPDEFALLDRNGDGMLSQRELDAYLDGGHGCRGCHGGGPGWGEGLGELLVALMTLFGLGVIGSYFRP